MVLKKEIIFNDGNTWGTYSNYYPYKEDVSELEVLPNGAIILPKTTLDELDWKTKTKLMIIEQDDDLHQITLGKQLQGKEFVDALNKLRDRF